MSAAVNLVVRQCRETTLLLPGPLLLSVLLTGPPSLSPLSSILWRCCSIPVTSPLSQGATGAVTSRCKASPILSKGRKKEQPWGGSHPSKPMRKKRESEAFLGKEASRPSSPLPFSSSDPASPLCFCPLSSSSATEARGTTQDHGIHVCLERPG